MQEKEEKVQGGEKGKAIFGLRRSVFIQAQEQLHRQEVMPASSPILWSHAHGIDRPPYSFRGSSPKLLRFMSKQIYSLFALHTREEETIPYV